MKCEVTSLRLGEIIEPVRISCGATNPEVVGVDINHRFIPTRANLTGVDTSKYLVVPQGCFACNLMHIGRDERIPLAYNDTGRDLVITHAYSVFRVKPEKEEIVSPLFLYLYLCRQETDRYTWFCTDSSIRGNLPDVRLNDIEIPVPDMETQQRLVNVWSGLDGMKRDNDAQAAPLMELCMSYLKKLREEYPLRALSDNLIERVERFNSNAILGIDSVRGVSNTKEIIQTRANVSGREVKDFLVLNHHEFIFNRRTTRNGERLGLGFNESDTPILFTNDYVMFKVKDEDVLLPEFLYLCFKRDEFDRYVRWDSWGSATEFFNWENMQRVRIPIPPKAIQQAIVDIYTCAKECRDIAEQADNLRKVAGPALMQKAIHP